MTHSWNGGSQTQTFFLNSEGDIYSIGQYSGLSRVDMDIILLYMLLNPLEYIDGWVHQDIDQAKKEQAIDTYSMIGLQSQW